MKPIMKCVTYFVHECVYTGVYLCTNVRKRYMLWGAHGVH